VLEIPYALGCVARSVTRSIARVYIWESPLAHFCTENQSGMICRLFRVRYFSTICMSNGSHSKCVAATPDWAIAGDLTARMNNLVRKSAEATLKEWSEYNNIDSSKGKACGPAAFAQFPFRLCTLLGVHHHGGILMGSHGTSIRLCRIACQISQNARFD
jgi:hypothetical protein